MVLLTVGAMGLAAVRSVPLKMLPFDNKNELLLVLDFDEGTTLERSDAAVRDFEAYLAGVPEVADYTSYVGARLADGFQRPGAALLSPAGRQRRRSADQPGRQEESRAAEPCHRPADAKRPAGRSPTGISARMKLVETPPGPPVIASVVAEVYGQPDNRYEDLLLAADTVRARLAAEPGVVDVDDVREAAQQKLTFVTDKEKAALNGVTTEQIASTLQAVLGGSHGRPGAERHGAQSAADSNCGCPSTDATSAADLARVQVKGDSGQAGPAGRTGALGHRPRRPDDLPQESPARGLCLRRDRRPAAGRRGRRRAGRQDRCLRPCPSDAKRVGNGWVADVAGHGRSTSARSSPTAAASPGPCRRASRSTSPAKGNGKSRSTCFATWGWPSARR